MKSPKVFLSSPSVQIDETAGFQQAILAELTRREITIIRLERAHYALPPWEQLRAVISGCDGAVVLGLRQLRVVVGECRASSEEARPDSGWRATPWNQLEAGMAIMARLPLLVVPETEVGEGVFAPDTWGRDVFGVPSQGRAIASHAPFESWLDAVVGHANGRGS